VHTIKSSFIHLLSHLAGFGHSGTIGIGFPILRKKESYQGSGGPASWTLVKQRWLSVVGWLG